jgi:glycosyltransferase involved in cell wall biosynthesis
MPFYKFAISHSNGMVIFQNPDDRNMMLSRLGHKNLKTSLIKGSGVDTENYPLVPEPDDPILVTMAARLLRDKGVSEFVAAAKQLSDEGCNAKFQIAGGNVAEGNPGAYSKAELDTLKGSNIVNFLGHQEDMPTVLSKSNIVVLPSYHEGLPKVLVEAGAAGRPVVTADVPGCRDAVIHLQTGILVPVKDARALAEAIKTLVDDKQMRIDMGNAGRNFVENELSIDIVIDQHMAVYDELLASKTGSIVDRQ